MTSTFKGGKIAGSRLPERPPRPASAARRAEDERRVGAKRRLRVCLVTRHEPGTTGTSRYVDELAGRLAEMGVDLVHRSTRPRGRFEQMMGFGRMAGFDLNAFLAQYPIRLDWPDADVYHLSVQTYASLLHVSCPPGPVVVTVHDIIPYLVRDNRHLSTYRHTVHRWFDMLAMHGLKRADAVMADSEWTKGTLVSNLGLTPERITTVPLAVDRQRFRPLDVPSAFRQRYGLGLEHRHILYVGSEDPRKNLNTLWRAFALVLQERRDVRLIKIGAPHVMPERHRLLRLAEELGVTDSVRLFDAVPESDLPLFYNVASVCVLPSLYEGFGLPVVEALACGTPVVCSDRASLVELATEGVTLTSPTVQDLAVALLKVVDRDRRVTPPPIPGWEDVARRALTVYEDLASARYPVNGRRPA